ncbi:MAG: class I SAM-dependent methyltransferase [Saprospirales bacterium]|nr:MAG: class I SAM-dependent methyltransferase [Saprospirales bacterium]
MNDKTAVPNLESYYKFHATIYDLTRWSFLYGRKKAINELNCYDMNPVEILEVGCGTGANLIQLAKKFPASTFTGIDLSTEMLDKAAGKKNIQQFKVELIRENYLHFDSPKKYDIILFSYALTMMGKDKSAILEKAIYDLNAGGIITIVDFHSTEYNWFRKWMEFNHVEMEKLIDKNLLSTLKTERLAIKKAYFGLWKYFIYWGRKA